MSAATASFRSPGSAARDLAAAAAGGRMRGAARGDVEVARQQIRKRRGRGDARRVAAAAGAAVDVLVVRTLDRVGAGERLDRRRILGQAGEQGGEIVEPAGDDMDDAGFLLQLALHRDIARAQDDRAEALDVLGPTVMFANAVP